MAYPAGELRPVKPMIKHYRCHLCIFRIVIYYNSAVPVRTGPCLLLSCLGQSNARCNKDQNDKEDNSFHELFPFLWVLKTSLPNKSKQVSGHVPDMSRFNNALTVKRKIYTL